MSKLIGLAPNVSFSHKISREEGREKWKEIIQQIQKFLRIEGQVSPV